MLSSNWTPSSNLHWVDVMSRLRLFNNVCLISFPPIVVVVIQSVFFLLLKDILVSMWVGPDGKDSESHIIQVREFYCLLFSCIALGCTKESHFSLHCSWTRAIWLSPVALTIWATKTSLPFLRPIRNSSGARLWLWAALKKSLTGMSLLYWTLRRSWLWYGERKKKDNIKKNSTDSIISILFPARRSLFRRKRGAISQPCTAKLPYRN